MKRGVEFLEQYCLSRGEKSGTKAAQVLPEKAIMKRLKQSNDSQAT